MVRAKLSAIIACFESSPELGIEDLCERLEVSHRSLRSAVKSLVSTGFIEIVPTPTKVAWDHGDIDEVTKYRLTPLGKSL